MSKLIKAGGEIKHLLHIISEIQNKVGFARSLHFDDRSTGAFEKAQELLEEAFDLCLTATEKYDPKSYDSDTEKENQS